MKRLVVLVLLVNSFAAAKDSAPSIRICVGSIENRSSLTIPMDDVRRYFLAELNHKNIKAISIAGSDPADEMAKNACDYLVRGEFSDYTVLKPGEAVKINDIVVDNRKKFALQFGFELKKSVDSKPMYSDQWTVVDKNPKTCAEDHFWEAAVRIRAYFNRS